MIVVSSTAELLAAIAACAGGETIKCGPATYAGIGSIDGRRFASPITITRTGVGGAIFPPFNVTSCSGITFTDIAFTVSSPTLNAYPVSHSDHINFTRIVISGPADAITDDSKTYNGLGFSDCQDCATTDCAFHHLTVGAQTTLSRRVRFERCHVHHIRIDGFETTETNGATWLNCFFHDFYPLAPGGDADHPDCIQLWTDNVGPSSNILVRGCVMMRNALGGDGLGRPQGVFFDDLNSQGFASVTITDNFLAGMGFNGIYPAGSASKKSTGIVITDNELWSYDSGANQSWIRMQNTVASIVTGNRANAYILTPANDALTNSGNSTNAPVSDGGAAALAAWLVTHPEMAWILTV